MGGMQEQSGKRDAEAWHGWLVQVWHHASLWAAQSRVQKEQSESYSGAVPDNNIYIPQHHLLLRY